MRKLLPVRPLPLKEQVLAQLRDGVLNGTLQAGLVYNELSLAGELGVSRTPVREALLELAGQGLVTFVPHKGVAVKSFSRSDAEEVFEIRQSLETLTIEKVASSISESVLDEIDEIERGFARAASRRDFTNLLRVDRAVHLKLAEVSGNKHILAITSNLYDIVHVMASDAIKKPGYAEQLFSGHEILLECLRQRDVPGAAGAMRNHLMMAKKALLEACPDLK